MRQNEPITHIMATDLVTATTQHKFSEVKALMEAEKIHHLPIVEGKKLVGLISRIDILRFTNSQAFVDDTPETAKSLDNSAMVSDIMTTNIITLKESDVVKHAVEIVNQQSFNSVPVVNDDGELVGIVTTKDLLNYLYKQY